MQARIRLLWTVLTLLLFTAGCAKQLGRETRKAISHATVASGAYYCRYGLWPSSGEKLKTFAKNELEDFCENADCNALANINFKSLSDGRLRITFQEKNADRSQLCTVTITQPNSCVWFQKDTNAIDVFVGGKHFTTYRYGPELTKPILYPVKSPSGIVITRSFPFEIVPGESNDHPHHTGMFFTYDKVNNNGFWNNTKSPPQIKHIKVTKAEDGQLSVISHWVGRAGKRLLEEKRDMTFSWHGLPPTGRGESTARMVVPQPNESRYIGIDFNIMLTAQDGRVVFSDTKEGMFAIRLADWLREDGGTGEYLNSEGQKGEPNVWGRRAKWVRLEGHKDSNIIGVAIFHHPDSVNYPAYWMARGYGLFAANPLGRLEFQKATKVENPQPFNLTLQPGQSAAFKFRLIIYEGQKTAQEIEKEFISYAK